MIIRQPEEQVLENQQKLESLPNNVGKKNLWKQLGKKNMKVNQTQTWTILKDIHVLFTRLQLVLVFSQQLDNLQTTYSVPVFLLILKRGIQIIGP